MTRQRGFTLVEILVVIIISTILASITLLSLRDTSDDYFLRDDLARLAALLQRNCRDALISGQHLGIRVDNAGYAVFRYEGAGWVDIQAESVIYRHNEWSNAWRLRLEFQGLETEISEADGTPQLICLGSGELLPFRLVLGGGLNFPLVLYGRANGQITIEKNR